LPHAPVFALPQMLSLPFPPSSVRLTCGLPRMPVVRHPVIFPFPLSPDSPYVTNNNGYFYSLPSASRPSFLPYDSPPSRRGSGFFAYCFLLFLFTLVVFLRSYFLGRGALQSVRSSIPFSVLVTPFNRKVCTTPFFFQTHLVQKSGVGRPSVVSLPLDEPH